MREILITGANGYLGARLSKLFFENGYTVTGICYPTIPDNLEWQNVFSNLYCLDLRDNESVDKITNNEFDVAIHLVSLDHYQSNGEPHLVTSINITPTFSLLKSFSEKNNLKKFIYFSTIHVYGKLFSKKVVEDREPNPQNIYGLTHLVSEQICNYYNRNTDINCINVRLSNSYGSPVFKDNNCWWLVVNDLCKNAFVKKGIFLKSDGSPQRDFVHISDVYRAVEILANNYRKNIENNIYHISFGKTQTILELAHIVKKVYKERYQKEINVFLPNNLISRSSEDFKENERYTICNAKIKELGFLAKTDLISGINEIFEYIEQNYE